jgi:STE24 endopeptidase
MPGIARKIFVWALIVVTVSSASAQPAIQPTADITKVPVAAQPSPHFDDDAATETYMALMPPKAVAHSNAYFEGGYWGYWLILWGFLYASAVSLLLLNLRWSARMRDLAVRTTHFPIHRRRNGSRLPA